MIKLDITQDININIETVPSIFVRRVGYVVIRLEAPDPRVMESPRQLITVLFIAAFTALITSPNSNG